MSKSLILASSSAYRKHQLSQLGLDFTAVAPEIDESPLAHERPSDTAMRLAEQKCSSILSAVSAEVVIGSDQVCTLKGQQFGKPGTVSHAIKQLQLFSGNCIEFFTALCVMTSEGHVYKHNEPTLVQFRKLTHQEIENYIALDQPLDCAGSFKIESLGLSLFSSVESKDPSALLGLPLIKLCEFLRHSGIRII